jgi:tetratricopeptide (TPR) repeat protein
MLDCQLFGLNPRGHHATNLMLHAANVALLFLLLRWLTGAVWRSAFAAAVFAVHPVNVATVAWVSSRKDVLSLFLALLTLALYVRYTRRRAVAWYVGMMAAFALALMAKPMVMTLPFVLLLLDYWPLRRLDIAQDRDVVVHAGVRLLTEKAPLFVLSVVFAGIAFFSQSAWDSVMSSSWYPLSARTANAALSTLWYLWKLIWPAGFTAFYPYPGADVSVWPGVLAVLIVTGITAAVVWRARTYPYLAVGWFWYLIAFLPVSGLVAQLGSSAHADRYAYLPLIGIYIAIAWGAEAAVARRRSLAGLVYLCAVMAVGMFAALTWREIGFWRDSETLWTRALEVTTDNAVAESSLGEVYLRQRQPDKAFGHFSEALRIAPTLPLAQNNFGILLAMRGDIPGAAEHFEKALELKPDYPRAASNLAKCRVEEGRLDEAYSLMQDAFRLTPEYDPNRAAMEQGLREIEALRAQPQR